MFSLTEVVRRYPDNPISDLDDMIAEIKRLRKVEKEAFDLILHIKEKHDLKYAKDCECPYVASLWKSLGRVNHSPADDVAPCESE